MAMAQFRTLEDTLLAVFAHLIRFLQWNLSILFFESLGVGKTVGNLHAVQT